MTVAVFGTYSQTPVITAEYATTESAGVASAVVTLTALFAITTSAAGESGAEVTLVAIRGGETSASGVATTAVSLTAVYSIAANTAGVATTSASLTRTLRTGKYAAEHATALTDVQAAGAWPITFTGTEVGTYDPETGIWTTPTATTTEASAIQISGDPEQYRALSLIESEAPTLLVVTTTYGGSVGLGNTVQWAGQTYTTKAIKTIGPDGVPIMAKVVVGK